MHCSIEGPITAIPAATWDRLAGPQPFMRHAFLAALEEAGCVGAGTGWSPEMMLVCEGDRPLAAVALYRKSHSYGEYVFDWAWARAYQQAGIRYYPKLVVASPFTPVTGRRLLCAADAPADLAVTVHDALQTHARTTGASSIHWLFTGPEDTRRLADAGLLLRTGYQFHWHNEGWRDFTDFLGALTHVKRKSIRRERQSLVDAGVRFTFHEGPDVTEAQWDLFYGFYRATIEKYGAIPYLTRRFFSLLGERVPGTLLLMAEHAGRAIAGALYVRDTDTLYGRYWGTVSPLPGLHFETCYYQAIDYCLQNGLQRFEAGAQGPHKLSRGFLPATTSSLHWLDHPSFNQAVADFLARERAGLEYQLTELNEHSPFRHPAEPT
ncbi:MAG: GNAT family N-acetyltransferase [Gammaproteobacteria bacterium]|nr:GNAT family N-acetyltransferase [Gammaproteobacteria bacterium]